jgi:AraC family transcriptional regulator of adaptative response/methylated-DNA-[protein]-cysteine methyltransferase
LSTKQHTLSDTAFETGLSGTGRLHDLFVNIEGMTPGEYKNGGALLTIHYMIGNCLFGKYMAASTGKGICNLSFFEGSNEKAVDELRKNWPGANLLKGTDEHLQKIEIFFSRDATSPQAIKLHLKGTAFQLKVWQALLQIREGDVSTYGRIAKNLAQQNAFRAVGTAIGSNPVGYIIPCHRVIKSMGETGGYRWGTTRKKAMLLWEAGKIGQQYEKAS